MNRIVITVAFLVALVFSASGASLMLHHAAHAQAPAANRCAGATDPTALVLSPEQVGTGFAAELIPSPGRVDPSAPGWTGLPVLTGFQDGLVRVSLSVSSFEDADSAARFAAEQATAGAAAVRCGAFVVGIGATIERQAGGPLPQIFEVPALAWAVLGSVIAAPADCVTTHGRDGVPVASCGDNGSVVYDPETGRWLDLPRP